MSRDHIPTSLADPIARPARALLFRLAAGEEIVTRRYAPEGGFRLAQRRGYIASRQLAARVPQRLRPGLWRHDLTPRGRAAIADVLGGRASSPAISS